MALHSLFDNLDGSHQNFHNNPYLALLVFCNQIRSTEGLGLEESLHVASIQFRIEETKPENASFWACGFMLIVQVTTVTKAGGNVKDYNKMDLKVRAEKSSVGIATENASFWQVYSCSFCILQVIICVGSF